MSHLSPPAVAVVGGGPAGLMAAEMLAEAGHVVDLYDAMPSVGRKFLLAGVGGMNITHSEAWPQFVARYGSRSAVLRPYLDGFDALALRDWVHGLGIETFVGSSGKVFPREMKAAPLLRAWLQRLREHGVRFHVRHRWLGWDADGALQFSTPDGLRTVPVRACLLALGGASWKKLGSDGAWVPVLAGAGAEVVPLAPANCGFDAGWTAHFAERFAGQPLKSVRLCMRLPDGQVLSRLGECVVTATGLEGGLIYAFSAPLREAIAREGQAHFELDLLPAREADWVLQEVARPRGSRSMASHLQSRLGLKGVRAGLLRECLPREVFNDPALLAAGIKALPVRVHAPRPIDEAISTAGGVAFESLTPGLMLKSRPGVFVAGEMLDWEAPTGGYLLTACLATGRAAGLSMATWLTNAG